MKSSAQQSSSASQLTLLELIVMIVGVSGSIVAAVIAVHHVRDARIREYRTGFVRGIVFAVEEGDDGGVMCGDDNPEMRGFHDGRFVVGRDLSPTMSIAERVQQAQAAIHGRKMTDETLNDHALAALRKLVKTGAK